MNYLTLNGLVLIGVIITAYLYVRQYKYSRSSQRAFWYTLLAVLSLTAVFDSLIIACGIVAYDTSHILGVYIGRAPIEDFAYACVSVIVVVILWEYYDHQS